ncbi:MAG: sigma-54 dependent transcriptional regulator, acetoin dehydrogenase operon transcriptional [Nocardioidaceae bacterium]|nr:sigma-54 dependent transcriptional regulator, acetoin dehydrogenase operon transcriptional [Nocardioidaceae bacterium]
MNDPADRKLQIAAARAEFLSSRTATHMDGVPDVVAASWQRSASAGVGNAGLSLRHYDDVDVASRLVRCAQPVIARLSDETADLALSIALTDSRARILTRTDTSRTIALLLDNVSLTSGFGYAEDEVGTNGIGTVLESGASVHIEGPEHFVEPLQPFSCAGAPIRDPVTGRVEGVLDISCLAEHSSPMMHSLVRSAANQIERGLLVDRSQCQQALFDTYLRTDARSREAVIAVGDSLVMMNSAAQALLSAEDQAALQEHTRFLMAHHDAAEDRVDLPSGVTVRVRGTRIMVGKDIAGMVVVITSASRPAAEAGFEDLVLPASVEGPWPTGQQLNKRRPPADASVAEGRTPAWRAAVDGIAAAVRKSEPLLVMGEPGTGKFTLLTEVYHSVQPGGRSLNFAAADISSVSYEDAEVALEGTTVPTLYVIRNIDQLTTDGADRLGAFMLSAVESSQPVAVAATVSDTAVGSGLPFCELLPYFQTAVTLPPLRQRSADIGSLVARVLGELAPHREIHLSPEAMRLVTRYTWPRNVRQLEEALASALQKKPVGQIEERDLPGYCHTTARRTLTPLEEADRDAVIAALKAAGGNRVHAAKALGLARSSLYRRLKEYGITTV